MDDNPWNTIKNSVANKLDIDESDVAVNSSLICEGAPIMRVIVKVPTGEITIIKPASKFDMFKLAMPDFIQNIFKPKTVEDKMIVALAPLLRNARKDKIGVFIPFTIELIENIENQEALVDWCVNGANESLQYKINNTTFQGW